jgi:hypothetical protein
MFTITIWLKIITAVDVDKAGGEMGPADLKFVRDAAAAATPRLKNYLTRIIAAMKPPKPFKANVGLDPTDEQVGARDVVVYLTTSSLARSFAARNKITLAGGSANGQTAPFDQGALSEIFIPAIRHLGPTVAAAGIVTANLAIHEIAHNKCAADPSLDPEAHVHANGGGGLLGKPIMPAMIKTGDLSGPNATYMAQRIDRQVPQLTSYLFSERLGF